MEIVLELVGEFLLQIVMEVLVELGFHSLGEPFRKRPRPWLAAPGYALLGAVSGGISLLVFPHHLTPEPWRLANVLIVPVLAGVAMMSMGRWRERRGHPVLRIDRFGYGFLFALALAAVRYGFAS